MGQCTDGAHCFCCVRCLVARTHFRVSRALLFTTEHTFGYVGLECGHSDDLNVNFASALTGMYMFKGKIH